ncbi:unnamed protein product [Rotaria sordida]|uniref:ADP-ribosylglycohydrolase n=1 Tax=Rotaria sordida TaxID=392033 RepID=A0A814M609_9BILA|nr:unnamed protein product [Rotaria sordida]
MGNSNLCRKYGTVGVDKSESDRTNKSESATNNNEAGETTNINTFGPKVFEKKNDLATPNDVNESKKTTDVNKPTDSHELEGVNNVSKSSNSSQVERTNTSGPSHDHNEQERINKENTTSTNNNLKRKVDSVGSSSSFDESNKSDGSTISYSDNELDLLESILKTETNQKLMDRLLGCAYGQALGDAYGLSTEFETRNDVAYNYPDRSKIIPFPDYILTGHSRRWKRGDWTDDTDQWILILETLTETNNDEPEDVVFAKKLTSWIRRGYPELGDYGGMGLGANVSQVVHSHGYINDPLRASEAVWERGNRQAAPNGAVMRCSASAFVHFEDRDKIFYNMIRFEKVISTATLMCKTTHFDPRCIASCLAVCLAITDLLNENFDQNDIESLIERVRKETIEILGDSFSAEDRKLFLWHTDKNRTLEELNLDESRTIGYTYKCLGSGFYGLRSTRSFEETLNDLIRYGGDADTNGAVCGTMYGARHGYKALPYSWLRAMPFKKWFDKKIIQCFKQMDLIEM